MYYLLLSFILFITFIGFFIINYFAKTNKDKPPKAKIEQIINIGEPTAIVKYRGRYYETNIREDQDGEFYIYYFGQIQYLEPKEIAKLLK